MPRNRVVVPILAALLAACGARQAAEFRLSGEAGTLGRLTGEWAGTYESPMLGRSGSIVFSFPDSGGSARGDVVMVPPGQLNPVRPAGGMGGAPNTAGGPPGPPPTTVVTIEFVAAAGDSITGTVSPYHDPSCSCTAQATFTGRIAGDEIRGTFVSTRMVGSERVHGTWEVRRRR